jgi:hypothetical protein
MEHIMDMYAAPYDPERPVIGFDEMPYQRLADMREPLLAAPGKVRRQDYEYARQGTCNVLLAFEPLTGRRHVQVTETRKNPDCAQAMQELATTHSPHATALRLMLDNLSTHYARRVLSALCAAGGSGTDAQDLVALHAQAWQMVEHVGM